MSFFGRLLTVLKDFVTSKKVLTAVLTGVASMVVKDPATRTHIVEIGAVLLAGQGLNDHGKAAAEVKATSEGRPVKP